MRAGTCVVLLTAGAIMALAVTGQPGFIDLHLTGVILMIAGAAGLWPYGGQALMRLGQIRLRRLLDQTPPVQGTRVPLEDLLSPAAPRQPTGDDQAEPDVWAPWSGHQELARTPQSRLGVIESDQADASAQAD